MSKFCIRQHGIAEALAVVLLKVVAQIQNKKKNKETMKWVLFI